MDPIRRLHRQFQSIFPSIALFFSPDGEQWRWMAKLTDRLTSLTRLDWSFSIAASLSLTLSLSLSLSGRMESDEIRWNNDGIAGRETGRGKEQENGGESYLFDVHLGARRQLSITDVSFYYHFFNPPLPPRPAFLCLLFQLDLTRSGRKSSMIEPLSGRQRDEWVEDLVRGGGVGVGGQARIPSVSISQVIDSMFVYFYILNISIWWSNVTQSSFRAVSGHSTKRDDMNELDWSLDGWRRDAAWREESQLTGA